MPSQYNKKKHVQPFLGVNLWGNPVFETRPIYKKEGCQNQRGPVVVWGVNPYVSGLQWIGQGNHNKKHGEKPPRKPTNRRDPLKFLSGQPRIVAMPEESFRTNSAVSTGCARKAPM